MKKVIYLVILVLGFMLSACGEYTKIPTGYVAQKTTAEGILPEIFQPGQVWLDHNTFSLKQGDDITLLEISEQKYKETIKTLLKDKLTFQFDIYTRMSAARDVKSRQYIFKNVTAVSSNGKRYITNKMLYNLYVLPQIRSVSRSVMEKYNTEDISLNLTRIKQEMKEVLYKSFKDTPIHIGSVSLSDVQYPEMVTKAIEKAKNRQMQIQEEKAKVQITLEKARGQELLAKTQYRIKMLEAKRIRDYNKMISEGVTPDLLSLRNLELREKYLDKWTGVLPTHILAPDMGVILGK